MPFVPASFPKWNCCLKIILNLYKELNIFVRHIESNKIVVAKDLRDVDPFLLAAAFLELVGNCLAAHMFPK